MTGRIHFILVRRVPPVHSPVLAEVDDILRRRGFVVTGGIPEETLTRADLLDADHDLVVLKSHTELALSLAGIYHGLGARVLNPYESCLAAQDKLTACRRLRAVGVPVPRTWATADLALVGELLERTPLVVKPVRGHRGAGVVVLRHPDDLAPLVGQPSHVPFVVQEHVPGPGEDLKVYVVGDHVHAVRKPFSPDSFTVPGRPVPVTGEVRDVALRCGEALGLGLYGLDMIESAEGPVVVDVNYFPGYKGVPGVAPIIAAYIEGFVRGDVQLVAGGRRRDEPALT